MKKVTINLPFATITIHRNLDAGIITLIQDLPMGHWRFTEVNAVVAEGSDDDKVDAYFNIFPTDQPIKRYDKLYLCAEMALAIGKEIFEKNFFDTEGVLLSGKTSTPDELREEITTLSQLGVDLTTVSADVAQWVANDGMRLAGKLHDRLIAEPAHPTHVDFESQEVTNAEKEPMARICLPSPAGGRIHGTIFMGRWEAKTDQPALETLGRSGMSKRLMETIKASLGIDLDLDQSNKPKGEVHRFFFDMNGFVFTCVLDLPFPNSANWFAEGVLEKAVEGAIFDSIKKITDTFGRPAY